MREVTRHHATSTSAKTDPSRTAFLEVFALGDAESPRAPVHLLLTAETEHGEAARELLREGWQATWHRPELRERAAEDSVAGATRPKRVNCPKTPWRRSSPSSSRPRPTCWAANSTGSSPARRPSAPGSSTLSGRRLPAEQRPAIPVPHDTATLSQAPRQPRRAGAAAFRQTLLHPAAQRGPRAVLRRAFRLRLGTGVALAGSAPPWRRRGTVPSDGPCHGSPLRIPPHGRHSEDGRQSHAQRGDP